VLRNVHFVLDVVGYGCARQETQEADEEGWTAEEGVAWVGLEVAVEVEGSPGEDDWKDSCFVWLPSVAVCCRYRADRNCVIENELNWHVYKDFPCSCVFHLEPEHIRLI
jgi:hypothetical protein